MNKRARVNPLEVMTSMVNLLPYNEMLLPKNNTTNLLGENLAMNTFTVRFEMLMQMQEG
jgi:hypothetical protein